jgi:putative ABC transport system permease protein
VGGIIGLALVLGLFALANYGLSKGSGINFVFVVSTKNILIGLFTSIFLGIIFGIIPALMASRLHPVDAMRSN